MCQNQEFAEVSKGLIQGRNKNRSDKFTPLPIRDKSKTPHQIKFRKDDIIQKLFKDLNIINYIRQKGVNYINYSALL